MAKPATPPPTRRAAAAVTPAAAGDDDNTATGAAASAGAGAGPALALAHVARAPLRALAFVLGAGALRLVAHAALQLLVAAPLGAGAEMREGAAFRDFRNDPLAVYALAAPFVQAALSLLLALTLAGPSGVARWSLADAAAAAAVTWLAGAGQGILLDLATFRMTWRVAALWWAGSLAAELAATPALIYLYGSGNEGGVERKQRSA